MGGTGYQSIVPNLGGFGFNRAGRNSIGGANTNAGSGTRPQIPDQMDIDDRVSVHYIVAHRTLNFSLQISRAVQQEVERRLAEREGLERERLEGLERQGRERAAERERQENEQRASLMKKHDDLNKLLKKTLRKAEKEK